MGLPHRLRSHPTSGCERGETSIGNWIGFLRRAVGFYRSHGITVERLMTDNGSAYISPAHALACRSLLFDPSSDGD